MGICESKGNNEIKRDINNSFINKGKIYNEDILYEHEPGIDKENLIKIIFENNNIGNISIYIDSNKTIEEMISFYFEIIKRPELYGDEKILFLRNGNAMPIPYSKEPIETLKNKGDTLDTFRIVVIDQEDIMKKKF
jgi:hypothetical protein